MSNEQNKDFAAMLTGWLRSGWSGFCKGAAWLWKKIRSSKAVMASLISILIGMVVGSIIILISGLTSETLGAKTAWEGIQLVFAGLFSTGRDASGALTFGFNPQLMGNMLFRAMPLIMTGLSVALAQKTGLFNIGAPGQYLMGTAATLLIALYLYNKPFQEPNA